MKNHVIVVVFLMLFSQITKAQLFNNNGAYVYSEPGSVIKIQGSLANSSSGILEHNGLVIIDSSYINNTTSKTMGYGKYDVYQSWVNSGVFIRDTSTVNLKGLIQDIKGDSVTKFYNLNLLGTGEKKLFINSATYNILNINSNELATQKDTMFLENSNPSSLRGDFSFGSEGFISNLDSGAFVRLTNSVSTYYYPMGNKAGLARFRPIQVAPNNSLINKYSVSFYNYNPSLDSYTVTLKDSNLCNVNDKFYHKMGRINGTSPADIELGYLSSDGYFNTIGNHKNLTGLWTDIALVTNTTNIGSYNSNKRLGWSNFNNLPYSLANVRPFVNTFYGDTLVCNGTSSSYSVANNPSYTYNWDVIGGNIIGSDSTSSITVNWLGTGIHYTSLIVIDTITGCSSLSYTNNIHVGTLPIAGFGFTSSVLSVGTPIFIKDSSINSSSWNYNLGNGTFDNSPNSQTVFNSPGTFNITQIVYDSNGCSDTLIKTIFISDVFVFPNTFTPNGDGINDVLSFNCNGCDDYDLEIRNRWGQLLYQGTKGSEFWTGSTAAGEKVPESTYFYLLKIVWGSNEKMYKGFIQLFR